MPLNLPFPPEIQQALAEFTGIRQQIHAYPELGFEENRTSELVAARLREWGWDVSTGVGKTGVVGSLSLGDGKKRIGIRADMDALPIQEATHLPYASRCDGKMHACGHDGHTAILLAAARYLAETRRFNGTVRVIFQPAEEGLGGAQAMLQDGLFQRFPCDAIFGLHNAPGFPVGQALLKSGPMAASSDALSIKLTGKGAHGAMPYLGRDPIVAAAAIVMALQTIVSRNLNATESGVISVGMLHAGSAHNVIPETAELELSIRALSSAARDTLKQNLQTLVTQQAASFGVSAELSWRELMPVLVNSEAETRLAAEVCRSLLGEEQVIMSPVGMMGSEDFAYMLEQVPGCYLLIGNGMEGHGGCTVHNPGYDFNDAALPVGASIWARLVERFLPL